MLTVKQMGRRGVATSQAQLKGKGCGRTTSIGKCLEAWVATGFFVEVMGIRFFELHEEGTPKTRTGQARDETIAVGPATLEDAEARAVKARQMEAQDELLSMESDVARV